MSFKFFKLQYWDKRSADVRRCNCAVLPKEKKERFSTNRSLCCLYMFFVFIAFPFLGTPPWQKSKA